MKKSRFSDSQILSVLKQNEDGTAVALTDMNLDRDPNMGYRRPNYVSFGTALHYPGPLDILNTQITGLSTFRSIILKACRTCR